MRCIKSFFFSWSALVLNSFFDEILKPVIAKMHMYKNKVLWVILNAFLDEISKTVISKIRILRTMF